MIKYYHTNLESNSLQEIKELEVGCWAYVQNPSKTELCKLAKSLEIEQKMMLSVLDQQEHPRFSENDTCKLLLLDVPVTTTDTSKPIITLPLAIFVIRDDYIVTVSLQQYTFIDHFISGDIASFWTQKKSRFVIQLIYQIALSYLQILEKINKKLEFIEKKVLTSTKNEELLELLALENSLTYIITALRSNGNVLDKILKGNVIQLFEEDEELLEDAIIENNQAISMADLYRDILSSTADTVATIVSNNLNSIMKFLAGITIVFSIPTMVSSFMGMNVDLGRFGDNPFAFLLLLLISLLLSIIIALILRWKNML